MEYQKYEMIKETEITEQERQQPLEEQVVDALKRKGLHICCAESCTGGLLSGTIINVSGASDVINEGYVTYSNEAKQRLINVSNETLKQHGAVSFETACEMAYGVANASGAEVGVGITGVAGPTGGTKEKPVGLVYIGVCVNSSVYVAECHFKGERIEVRRASVKQAMAIVLNIILKM